MAAALVGAAKAGRRSTVLGRYGVGAAVLVVILIGIVLNGSLAAIALSIPVLIASVALLPAGGRWSRLALPLSALVLVGSVALLATRPLAVGALGEGASASTTSRTAISATTMEAIEDSFPVGTGLGSFQQVYRQYEDPMAVTPQYVNHAHNEYLQIALELGAPGLLLVAIFLAWWAVAAARIWQSPLSSPFARAATIATAAVLAHSIVDFPLRTAAIAAIFAAAVAMMIQNQRSVQETKRGQSRPPRHVELA